MKGLKQEYKQFLQDNFTGLKLRKPLFYRWDYGLRFDLQDNMLENNEYFAEVARRASTLFEAAFEATDSLLFVFKDYRNKRERIKFTNYAFRQIVKLEKQEICYTKGALLYGTDDSLKGSLNVAIIKLTINRIRYKNILAAIGNTDFPPRQPRLDNKGVFTSKEIYFINLTKKLIFHMYDDRGLDIIASNKETLHPIYEQYNNWILDYDREKIDKLFG